MIRLKRIAYTDMGTFGNLIIEGNRFCAVERPWHDNIRNESCIPIGYYPLRQGHLKGEQACLIINVAGRSHIGIHRGNVADDVQGCIALGLYFGCLGDQWAVRQSRVAMDQFWKCYTHTKPQFISIENKTWSA